MYSLLLSRGAASSVPLSTEIGYFLILTSSIRCFLILSITFLFDVYTRVWSASYHAVSMSCTSAGIAFPVLFAFSFSPSTYSLLLHFALVSTATLLSSMHVSDGNVLLSCMYVYMPMPNASLYSPSVLLNILI